MSAYEHFYQYFDGCSGKCTEFRGQINWSAQPNYNKTVTFCLCCIVVCNHYSWYSNGQSCKNYKNCLCPGCKKITRIVKPNFRVDHGDNTKLSLNNCSYLLKSNCMFKEGMLVGVRREWAEYLFSYVHKYCIGNNMAMAT